MKFWDYCVREDSESKRVESMARKLGFSGVCIFGKGSANSVKALLIDEKNPELMRKAVRKSRRNYEIIAVAGRDDAMNRTATETPEVDILLPGSGTRVDVVMAKSARKNGVRIGFKFGNVLHSSLEDRSRVFAQMIRNAQSVRKFRAPFVIVSGALSEFGMRAPSELIAFGRALGFDEARVKRSMSPDLADENKKRLSGKWIMPGVEVKK